MSNEITQLPHNLYGLEVFSLQISYLRYIGEQLQKTLNDKGRLGQIYKGITKFILAKFGGTQNIPRITRYDCMWSPITRTFFLLKHEAHIHLKSTNPDFFLEPSPLEQLWLQETPTLTRITPPHSQKLLQKLVSANILELKQITLPNGTQLMNHDAYKRRRRRTPIPKEKA